MHTKLNPCSTEQVVEHNITQFNARPQLPHSCKVCVRTFRNTHAFDFKVEGGAARDVIAGTAVAVAEGGWDDQVTLLADAHAHNTLIPSFDHLAFLSHND